MVLQGLAILATLSVIISGVIKMNISAKITKDYEYKKMNSEEKHRTVAKVKEFWKKCLINIAISIGVVFIYISTFMGNVSSYNQYIYIAISIISVIQIIILEMINRKMKLI